MIALALGGRCGLRRLRILPGNAALCIYQVPPHYRIDVHEARALARRAQGGSAPKVVGKRADLPSRFSSPGSSSYVHYDQITGFADDLYELGCNRLCANRRPRDHSRGCEPQDKFTLPTLGGQLLPLQEMTHQQGFSLTLPRLECRTVNLEHGSTALYVAEQPRLDGPSGASLSPRSP
ncbi:hypothetical protein WOLCODRAFT_153202 [Wolfiporia cocos MD-104 SS10]|uniref:Uncharacterized protein n=1 Tax=Wolfiporia cocos (strain MD-104) TaxID=742152 RepID=A0A2H3JLR7_WOLCO|nr:hypothetical protein WOLCODRAFT_153202 [Wolfiporia cocos MD-104 SS10]